MKMLKKAIGLLIAIVTCFSMVGCNGGENGGNSDKDKTTITIGVIGDKVETNIINQLKQGFLAKKENSNIAITTFKINNGYDAWVLQKMSTKTVPDMIQVYDFNCRYWTNRGLFRSVSDLMSRDGVSASDFKSSVIGLAQSGSDENYYWLPRDYNKMVVCINTEMFEAAGIEKPSDDWTMTDFYNTCKKLQEKEAEIKKITKQTTFYPAEMKLNSAEVYYPYMRAYGGDLFDVTQDGKVKIYNDLDKVKAGANALLSYADDGLCLPPDTDAVAFVNKQAAMIFTTRPNVQSYANRLNNKIDFVSMPTIENLAEGEKSYIGMGCTGYGITSSCSEDKLEAAWKFMKYIVSEEGQELFGSLGSGVPVLNSLLENQNSAWRKYISSDLNHEAFYKFPERDLVAVSYLDKIPVDKQLSIYQTLNIKLLKEVFEEKGTENRDDYYINNLKTTLERNLAS